MSKSKDASGSKSNEPQTCFTSEEEEAFFLTKYLYSWITPLFSRGWERNKLGELMYDKDLLHLPRDEDAQVALDTFKAALEEELVLLRERRKAAATPEEAALMQPRLFRVLLACNKRDVAISAVCRVLSDGLGIAASFFLRELVKWFGYTVYSPSMTEEYIGFVWSIGIALNQIAISLLNNASLFHNQKAFCSMRNVLALAIFEKSIKMDAQHGITGLVQQMHASDTNKFIEMSLYFHQMWSAPLIVTGALISLYYFIGWAGVLAFGVIIMFLPIQGKIAGALMQSRSACVTRSDKRIDAINEVMQGIRIVKFMGWEERFTERIDKIRKTELELFGKQFTLRSLMIIVTTYLPQVVSFFVFCVAYKGFDFAINGTSVFPAVSMLGVLRMPLFMLPMGISKLVDLFVSLNRIGTFLQREDKVDSIQRRSEKDSVDAVVMRNVTVQYYVEEKITAPDGTPIVTGRHRMPLMTNINLTIPRGKLTLVVGATGSGKSTLMNAMIGESLLSPESEVVVNGEIAFITQEAWIMNATLRDNILAGVPFEHERYLDSLNDCQLIADLQQLAASDMTEIGERGVNVSGGQKQRIAFARAVYSGREIVLMDDPLSAVDSHVCVALFEDCIVGALRDRTRVLVTHQVQFLSQADHIIVVDQCRVVFSGSYEELQTSTVDVASILAEATPQSQRNTKAAPVDEADLLDETPAGKSPSAGSPREYKRIRATEIPPQDHEELRRLMTTEHQVQGSIGLDVLGWYLRIQGAVPVSFAFVFFVLWRLMSVMVDLMISWWSSRTSVAGHQPTQDQYLQYYGIFNVLTLVFLILRQIPFVKCMLNAAHASNSSMVRSLLHAPTSFFDTTPTGRVISRFSKDMESMDVMIPESLNFFYNLVLVILGAYGVMIYSAYYLAAVLVFIIIVFSFMYRFYTTTNRAQKRLESANRSPMSSVLNETLGGLPTIRAYGMSENFIAKHYDKLCLSSRSVYSWRNSQRWLSVRVDAISSFVVVSTALLTCGLLVSYDDAQKRDILPIMSLAVTYAIAIGGAFGYLTTMTAELESAMSSVERVKEYCDELPQEKVVTYGSGPDEVERPAESWPSRGQVEFRGASLRYRDGLPLVLKQMSLTVAPGHKVGIVGRTGSGKSTVMLALFRMVELAEGAIFFDGVDISKLQMSDLRSKITIIPQDPMLFQGTIRSNLDPFFLVSDEAVWQVLEKVNMAERVRHDEVGLDSPVADKGANFSVGQRQLLCLARALLKGCKILMLDEATASVDFDADAMIQRTIRTEFADCTVLTIAHRLATVIDSDRIILLDHGVVQEYDSPANLVTRDSQFNAMLERLGPEQYGALKEQAIQAANKSHAN